MHPLDNPIWYALDTLQADFSQGKALAKRYPLDMAPFAATLDQSDAAFAALREVLQPEGIAATFTPKPWEPRAGWKVLNSMVASQMVCENLSPIPEVSFETLNDADVPEMQALVELTKPGPYRPNTHRLGRYIGLHIDGKLVAMAGERMRLTGFTEISAVCTHPDYQGRGYAKGLVRALCQSILVRGEIPFLHVFTENTKAIHTYERLGFKQRSLMYVTVLRSAID